MKLPIGQSDFKKVIDEKTDIQIECAPFINALLNGNINAFKAGLERVLMAIVSFHDFAKEPEAFFHALMIGLTAGLCDNTNYTIRSNRESGQGRYDYQILSKDKLTIIMEFKKVDSTKRNQPRLLKKEALKALQPIDARKYITDAKQYGAQDILKIGLAFSGKQFEIADELI